MTILEFYSTNTRGEYHHKDADTTGRPPDHPSTTNIQAWAKKINVNTDDVLALVCQGYSSYSISGRTEHRHVRRVITRNGDFYVASPSSSTDVPANARALDSLGGKPLIKAVSVGGHSSVCNSQILYGMGSLPVFLSAQPEDIVHWSRGEINRINLTKIKVHGMFGGREERIDLPEGTPIYDTTIEANGVRLCIAQLDKGQLDKIPVPVAAGGPSVGAKAKLVHG